MLRRSFSENSSSNAWFLLHRSKSAESERDSKEGKKASKKGRESNGEREGEGEQVSERGRADERARASEDQPVARATNRWAAAWTSAR